MIFHMITIKNGLVLTGHTLKAIKTNVIINDEGRIIKLSPNYEDGEIIDATNCIVLPAFINAHIHIGDSISKDVGDGLTIQELVEPPNGLKHQILAKASDQDLINAMHETAKEMLYSGTSTFIDFREGGIKGINLLKQAIYDLPINACILGRSDKYYDPTTTPEEARLITRELLQHCEGIGLSGVQDVDLEIMLQIAEVCNQEDKLAVIHVAEYYELLDTLRGGVRLKQYMSQMDCDTAMERGRVEGTVTDLVRAKRMERRGLKLRYTTVTNAYWQLITNRNSRIKQLKQLDDKMVAMTRYSATDLLTDHMIDSVKIDKDRVFKVQINDVNVRLLMLQNNEMDALWLTEPQATAARLMKHAVVYDTKKEDLQLGVIVFREKEMQRQARSQQFELLMNAYNQACDSINKYGVHHYRDLIEKRCHIKPIVVGISGEMAWTCNEQEG